jgi:hypothetical protein
MLTSVLLDDQPPFGFVALSFQSAGLEAFDKVIQTCGIVSRSYASLEPIRQRCEAFSPAFRYHWLYASGAIIASYYAANQHRGSPPVSYRRKQRSSHPYVASTE